MPRPRTPSGLAKVTGAEIAHPGRHAGRSSPKVSPLGPPPRHLTPDQRECWLMFADEMPWLGKSDRTLVETASRLRARMMTEPEFGVNAIAQLRMCLSAMGGTPSDRSKVAAPKGDDDEDPASEFVN